MQINIMIILKKIWPTIYRIINAAIFTTLAFLKSSVLFAIQQIKGQ